MAAPLPGNVQARQERKAAYEVTAQDVAKWQPMVKVRSACQDRKSGSTEVLPPALMRQHAAQPRPVQRCLTSTSKSQNFMPA